MSFDHHSAAFDLQTAGQQLGLIGDHLVEFPCARCLVKHFNNVLAYCSEGAQLDGAEGFADVFARVREVAQRSLDKILSCTSPQGACQLSDVDAMKEELRQTRDFIFARIYFGTDKTEQHDITQTHNNPDVAEYDHAHQVEE